MGKDVHTGQDVEKKKSIILQYNNVMDVLIPYFFGRSSSGIVKSNHPVCLGSQRMQQLLTIAFLNLQQIWGNIGGDFEFVLVSDNVGGKYLAP